ncbi:MAG: methylenetetrahydrofolate--tRNA-(uracil(54)-C(5))-methyltransferase (FADH(2)-oxidizing) TrmFO [Clostridia bacterium]|nr:methylenetetrahydrofolate--tRNA-(uracil(54)-C(5))-methyltransferase (FADH(2)-oxidizing) TrmFO [Clostridia bacterium]
MMVTVVGAGLAGCEAAWQLARQGISVRLVEMKPEKKSPAHHSDQLAELVCSNSLRSDRLTNGVGLLKEEMRQLSSLIMEAADYARVPAGGALAVDRDMFSGYITDKLIHDPHIQLVHEEVVSLPLGPCIIATGPLTSDTLAEKIAALPGLKLLNFYDAAAPIVTKESLDMTKIFRQSRYDRGDDYLNCPMDEAQYRSFVDELIHAQTAEIHGFEETAVFEGCMPVESMAKRGDMVLAFGPLKPVGLIDPRDGKMPFAVVQLRQDNAEGTLYNLVGFQTRLKFPEQKRIFGMIPGLENASFARYGVMHRNTFLHSPGFLNSHYEMIERPGTYFAGQITGVEGYVESAASGLLAGLSLGHQLLGKGHVEFPGITAIGSLGRYISTQNARFQPMNCTFGIIDSLPVDKEHKKIRNKQMRYTKIAERSLEYIRSWVIQEQESGPKESERTP